MFSIAGASGNTAAAGTFTSSGQATVGGLEVNTAEAHINGQNFRVSNGAGADKLTVTASTGDTTIAGTLGVTNDITGSSDIYGQAIAAQNGLTVTGAQAHVSGQNVLVTSDGSTQKFKVTASSGNTEVGGTLTSAGKATLNGGLEVTGGEVHVNAQDFKVSDGSSDTFSIQASSGNTIIAGTLDVTSDITGTGDVEGAEIRATNGLIVTNAGVHINAQDILVTSDGSTQVMKVTGASGNTEVGESTITSTATFNGGLVISGAETHLDFKIFVFEPNVDNSQ